jgi:hypothetical protein
MVYLGGLACFSDVNWGMEGLAYPEETSMC